jgi:hypothetical protein
MVNNLKVIIAGGGIAGLTLANALEVRFSNAILQHLANLVHSKRTLTMYFWSEEMRSLPKSAHLSVYFQTDVESVSYQHSPVYVTTGLPFADSGSTRL